MNLEIVYLDLRGYEGKATYTDFTPDDGDRWYLDNPHDRNGVLFVYRRKESLTSWSNDFYNPYHLLAVF